MNFQYLLSPLTIVHGVVLYWRIFGLMGTYHALYCLLSKRTKLVPVSTKWSKPPLYIRLNTSDVLVFRQIFIDREYEIVEQIGSPPATILDGGANIGLTSVFFAQLYPQAKIFAVEPETANLELLRLNTRVYPAIEVVSGALWNRDEPLGILDHGADSWAFPVSSTTENSHSSSIQGFRLSTLMERFGAARLWLLKLDIEGAEYEVLGDAANWIAEVENIVIELHENIRPGVGRVFADVTRDFQIRATSRELTLACRSAG